MTCPFCTLPQEAWIASNDLAVAFFDIFPVSPGHALFIPRRHVSSWFEATREEREALLALVDEVKEQLDARQPKPDGYNLGLNVGEVAGQSVMHLHMHLIPRFEGDVDDPRGGIRAVIPDQAVYPRSEDTKE